MKKIVLAIMALLMCTVLSGCGTAEFSLKMSEGNGTFLHLTGGYRANDELYLSGFNCAFIFRGTPREYGISFDTDVEWVWPGPTNPMQATMHPNIFGEKSTSVSGPSLTPMIRYMGRPSNIRAYTIPI